MTRSFPSVDDDTQLFDTPILDALGTRFVGRNELVYNVRDFGAKGDGTADDTDAIQAAIDAAIGGPPEGAAATTRRSRADVFVPGGTYNLSRPLKLYGVRGLRIYGSGFGTALVATVNMAAFFDLNGFSYGAAEYFYLRGAAATIEVTQPVKIDWDPAVSAPSTSSVTCRKIRVSDVKFVHAFAVGVNSSNLDVSQISLYDCFAAGKWVSGETTWYQGAFTAGSGVSGNVLNHWFYGCTANGTRYAFFCNNATMSVFGSSVGFCEVDFYQVGARPMVVDGFRSENSQRLFAQAGGGSYAAEASISNGIFTTGLLAADSFWIRQAYGGTVALKNVTAQPSTGKTPVIQITATFKALMTLTGVASTATLAGRFAFGTGATGTVVDINAYTINASGQVDATRAFWTKHLGALTPSQLPTFADGIVVGGPLQQASYTTATRPAAASYPGASIFDTTLGKPVWSNGAAWVDSTGTAV